MTRFNVTLSSVLLLLTSLTLEVAQAQVNSLPYSYQYMQKFNDVLYSPDTRLHTASKPLLFKGDILNKFDSLQTTNPVNSNNWFLRKIFNEHLVEVTKEDHTFYLDFLPDFILGKELIDEDKRTTWLNTRGFQGGVTIGDKFTFHASFFENQGVYPKHIDDYVDRNGVMPGQGTVKFGDDYKKDWMYATASLTYAFSDKFQTTLAYDKNFIGDGYRSLLLSDFSGNYSNLKFTGELGKFQYTSIWAYMTDPRNPRIAPEDTERRSGDGIKYGSFQYIDYNATNRLSIGLLASFVWGNQNEYVAPQGDQIPYLDYFNAVEYPQGPPPFNGVANTAETSYASLGLNAKYKVLRNVTAYGQLMLDDFTGSELFSGKGHVNNKLGAQIGARGYDIFAVKNLNFLAEYNVVRPYTYQQFESINNYSNHGEPLAHPRGANFREIVGIANYSWNRFDFSLQGVYSQYGTDPENGANMGGDIFQSYGKVYSMYDNSIAQGVKNDLYYVDAKAAYVLNPKYNLRFEVGYTQRYNATENLPTQKSGVINIGLRSSFRNFYGDF